MTREIGGYLPLELSERAGFFDYIPKEYIYEVNTGRTAIWCAIKSMSIDRIFVPFFYCPDVINMIKSMNIEVTFYNISVDLLPSNVRCESKDAIILVNYYGIVGKKLELLIEKYDNVIVDQAHAFYYPPILRKGVFNVYSCRKFFGVSDGAYLVGREIKRQNLEKDISYMRIEHLVKSLECGTNQAYTENKFNENQIGKKKLSMSVLTRKILGNIDYLEVAKKRRRNFEILHNEFRDIQMMNIEESNSVPYVYPLKLPIGIHMELVAKKIYIPLLWKEMLTTQPKESIEYIYAATVLPLPIDQRYNEDDMKYLVDEVKNIYQDKYKDSRI